MLNTTHNPLVTVLMPCYNAMPYLTEALDSIINQTYKNLEILCINDGSSDETGKVLDDYAQKDARIRVIPNEKNLKLIATLNKGIDLAKGEYIARMDADDISLPNRIECLFDFLLTQNADIVSCNHHFIDEKGNIVGKGFVKALSNEAIHFASYFFTPIGHPSLLAKKNIFSTYLYKEDSKILHCEDYNLWVRLVQNNCIFYNSPQHLYQYRLNTESVSRKYEEIQKQNFLLQVHHHQETYLKRKIPINISAVSCNRFESATIQEIKMGLDLVNEIKIHYSIKFPAQKKAFQEIADMQKLDIFIQFLKTKKTLNILFSFYSIFKHLILNWNSLNFYTYFYRKF